MTFYKHASVSKNELGPGNSLNVFTVGIYLLDRLHLDLGR